MMDRMIARITEEELQAAERFTRALIGSLIPLAFIAFLLGLVFGWFSVELERVIWL